MLHKSMPHHTGHMHEQHARLTVCYEENRRQRAVVSGIPMRLKDGMQPRQAVVPTLRSKKRMMCWSCGKQARRTQNGWGGGAGAGLAQPGEGR